MLLSLLGAVFVVAVICWAMFWRNSSIFYPTLVRGDRSSGHVALTFDDGPDPCFTARTLDLLAAHGAKATFFCVGRRVEQYPDLVRRIHAEGHLVASHGYDHSLADFFQPPAETHRRMLVGGRLIQAITGYFPRFYRPPVGIKTPPRVLSAYRLNLFWVGWSKRMGDGGPRLFVPQSARRLVGSIRSGDIVLLHDGKIAENGTPLSLGAEALATYTQALEMLLAGLKSRGLACVRLDALTGEPAGIDVVSDSAPKESSWRLIKADLLALTHERASPAWTGFSLGVGVFIGCSPFFGLHTFIALIVSLRFRLHKLAALLGTQISNPLAAPLVVLGCLQTGWWVLHGGTVPLSLDALTAMPVPKLIENYLFYWMIGLFLFGTALAALTGGALHTLLWLRRRRAW